ncbi:DUF547 domain-containing protein [Flavobacterium degerlachei]|jgi:hypothetical protein|uniref:DUF547 domain-containing protein n=1 Tax=Flavobacterium degerlachei TaxID=229203 RepID=A0A1H2R0T1_9FLAO|nr:DUF547 domain-containing protein [Flavobacterium degerlachei]SDW13076.1 Protein of unknown function, DUF547 [Flavobacterium degerlachei]
MVNFPIQLSESILLYAQLGQDSSSLRRELYFIKEHKLELYLNTDQLKCIFWVNIYNAYSIIIASEASRSEEAYKTKRIKVAHNSFSLNDIEYKILRINSRNPVYKFIDNLFCCSYIRKLAVKEVDYRLQSMLDRTPLSNGLSDN